MRQAGAEQRAKGYRWLRDPGPVAPFLALLLALPLLVVITSPFHTRSSQWAHIASAILPTHLGETLLLLAGVLTLALLLAVPSAWLTSQFDFPLRGLLRWALMLPLALPTYISAYTYAALLGPTGTFSNALARYIGLRPDVMGLPGLCLVLALVLFPYIYLPARMAFATGMSGHLEAARMLGAGRCRRFLLIALPLARPAIAGGAMLVAMETLNDYGAVKYFGVRTLTTGIFRSWGGLYDLGGALRLGLALLCLVALLLWAERRSRRGHATTSGLPIRPLRLHGAQAGLATSWCLVVLFLAALLPLGKLLTDVLDGPGDQGLGRLLPAVGNTLLVASFATAVILLIAVLFTYHERQQRKAGPLMKLVGLGYAVPGAVIAIGAMAVAGWIDRQHVLDMALIGSLGLLVHAFTARFLAVGWHTLRAGMQQQPAQFDDAARSLGASPWHTFRRVNLPLLRPALVAASMLVAIDVIKELPLTLVLRPFNFDTLSTLTYEMASIEQFREASWPALLIVLCGLAPVLLLERLQAHRER